MSIKILKKEPSSTKLPELDGREFYVLFTFLQTKAYELISSSVKSRFPVWSHLNVQQNNVELRTLVSKKVFDEFEDLLVELDDMPGSDKRYLLAISSELLSRPLYKFANSQLQQIYNWNEIRVEADFWFIGTCKEGGIFAYLGDNEEDEKIFIVKALADKFTEMLPSIPMCVSTALLNWKEHIIYDGLLAPCRLTPKDSMEKQERLVDIVARCSSKNKVRRSLASDDNMQVSRYRIGVTGEKISNFMVDLRSSRAGLTESNTEIIISYIYWRPFENEVKMNLEEFQAVLFSGKNDGYKNMITMAELIESGEKCRICTDGIYGSTCKCKKKHDSLTKRSGGKLIYCIDGVTCEDQPPYDTKKISLMDFYTFEFTVSNKDFLEIKFRLEECNLFFSCNNIPSNKSAFFHYVGPIILTSEIGSSSVMTFGSIDMFYKDNRIEINTSSLKRAMNIVDVMRFVILGNSYGNGQKIEVMDMNLEIALNSSRKDKPQINQNASDLVSKLEKFILGAVNVKIDRKMFDHKSCSFCGNKGTEENKLKQCAACTGKYKALYCSKECQKSHWKEHREQAGH